MSAAETHQRRGDLQQALFEYRVARTLVKQDTDIDNAIRRLEKHITEQTEQLTKRGKGAMRQGKTSKAGRLYLETLSLDPNHKDALAALRKLDEESSKRAMERKVALSKRNGTGRGRRQKKGLQGYEEEAYTYSRQAILQTENGPGNVREFIKELEKHIQKYPHDLALRRLLSKTHVKQAKKTYQAEKYDRTLNYLEKAERAVNGDKTKINAIARVRKEFAKALYIKGVRSSREEPEQALRYWKQALKFDPEDKRIRLRIQNMQRM
ncbi:MAG: hypothetical protein KZQ76_10855 [Candidatus Thiodiazotropha sp. (ex Epidulcina cf. delphinae)]|nr:hypothetical protein [Candidatus Thiodiazotropha sp. (ex Epidulcina cf. delphinae)]